MTDWKSRMNWNGPYDTLDQNECEELLEDIEWLKAHVKRSFHGGFVLGLNEGKYRLTVPNGLLGTVEMGSVEYWPDSASCKELLSRFPPLPSLRW